MLGMRKKGMRIENGNEPIEFKKSERVILVSEMNPIEERGGQIYGIYG